MGDMKEQARELKAEVEAGAREKGEALKQRAEEEIEWRKRETAGRAQALSDALETAGDALEDRGERWLAERARIAAERVERITDHVRDRDTRTLIHELEDTARQKPAMFLGGSFAAGLALGRFLHASGREAADGGTVGTAGTARSGTRAGGSAIGDTAGMADRGVASGAEDDRGSGTFNAEPTTGVRTGGAAMASRAAGSGHA